MKIRQAGDDGGVFQTESGKQAQGDDGVAARTPPKPMSANA